MVKHFRRRAYAKAAGYKLKKQKDIYTLHSTLSVGVFDSAEGSKKDRDKVVLNLVKVMSRVGFRRERR